MKGHEKDNKSSPERPMGVPDAPVTCAGPCVRCTTDPATCADSGEGLRGWRLVLGAVVTFLVPLVMAFAGSLIAGESGALQTAGAAVGLVFGIALAAVISRTIVRSGVPGSPPGDTQLPPPLGREGL
jgi:hypothetical protein